jgi:hypothetical protein
MVKLKRRSVLGGCTLFRNLALVLCFPASAVSQTNIQVPEKVVCVECTIIRERVASIELEGESVEIPPTVSLARDSKGRLFLGPMEDDRVISVFDTDGGILAKVGRYGSGTEEFSRVLHLQTSRGDSLRILDIVNQRFATLSPDYTWSRSTPLPQPGWIGWDFLLDADQNLLLQAFLFQKGRIGIPVHKINNKGEVLSSFGGPEQVFRVDQLPTSVRTIAWAGDGRVWVAYANRYEIELWDPEGECLMRLARQPEWFPSWDTLPGLSPHAPRQQVPTISSVWQDLQGLLWVFIRLPAQESEPPGEAPLFQRDSPPGPAQRIEAIVEVIDPGMGVLLASRRFDGPIAHIKESPYVYSRPSGNSVEVWRLHLESPKH